MIVLPSRDVAAIDSRGLPTQEVFGWMMAVTTLLNELSDSVDTLAVLTGSGSPEGVVDAEEGRFYLDTIAPAAYQKVGTGNTGWFAI